MQKQVDAMQVASVQTERAIAATNLLAAESHRLADAAAQSVGEARRLADAVAQQAETDRKALAGVQRPFIFVKGVEFSPLFGPQYLQAKFEWENSGNTATNRLILYGGCVFSDVALPNPWLGEDTMVMDKKVASAPYRFKTPTTIGPHETVKAIGCLLNPAAVAVNQMLTPLGVRAFLEHHIYMLGKAVYFDQFSPKYIHLTEFCRVVIDMTIDKNMAVTNAETAPCPNHNCADEECDLKDRKEAEKLISAK
jgi:hypothetical protein